jgi:hypothetical protein
MNWETVIGIETHAQMLNPAHQYQTATGWHQSIADA